MRGMRFSREAALRIGAIGLVAVVAALVVPGLLSPPEPPPLPVDVGFGATGATGAVPDEQPMRKDGGGEEGSNEARGEGARKSGQESRPRPAREREAPDDKRARKPQRPDLSVANPPPAPAPAPASAPAPVYVAPAPAPAPITDTPPNGEFGP